MHFAYTLVYVADVAASLAFFERAFGLPTRFLHESGMYGELETGATTLSFAAHAMGEMNFPGGHVHADTSKQPLGFEVVRTAFPRIKRRPASASDSAPEPCQGLAAAGQGERLCSLPEQENAGATVGPT